MSKIDEKSEWVPEIYRLTTEADVLGFNAEDNSDGPSNLQAEQLANRTAFLKQILDGIQSGEIPYVSVEAVQAAINSGEIPLNARVSVRGDTDDIWMSEYQNVNGLATATGRTLPTTMFILSEVEMRESLIKRIQSSNVMGLSEVLADDKGNITELLTEDGVRHFSSLAIGPIGDKTPVIKATAAGASMSGGEFDLYNVTISSIPMPATGVFSGAILIDMDSNRNVRRIIYEDGTETVAGGMNAAGDKEILPPEHFDRWVPDFKIYQRRDGSYYSDFDIMQRLPFDLASADHVVYVDVAAPDDGDGSISSPFNSLASISGLTGKVYLRARAGEYKGNKSFIGASIAASSLVIECWGPGRIVSSTETDNSFSWSKSANYTNVYEAPAIELGSLVDKSIFRPAITGGGKFITSGFDLGEHAVYRHVVTMAELDSTPGTCRLNAAKTTVYIHPFRSRIPDNDIVNFRNVANFEYSHPNAVLWMSDVSLCGGIPCRVATGQGPTTPMKIYGLNMIYMYSAVEISADYITNGASYSYHVNSVTSAAIRDGYGYHGIWPLVGVEIDCIGRRNGYDAAESNNGSTMHDGGVVVRLNSCYPQNQNRNVHDINSSQSWNIYCDARDTTGPIDNRYDYIAGAGNSSDATIMILQDCVGVGSTYNLATWQGRQTSAVIYVIGGRTDGLIYPNSNIVRL